jgi:hypothetical protein
MYVKITKRPSSVRHWFDKYNGWKCDYNKLQFMVVESFRDSGKVRHKVLAYLTTIPENYLEYKGALDKFWATCDQKLESFAEADRTKLTAKLETIIPRPTAELRQEEERLDSEATARWKRRLTW